jgi:hypothetical protein
MNKTKKKGKLLKAKFTATLLKSSKKGGWTYVVWPRHAYSPFIGVIESDDSGRVANRK